MKDTNCEQCQAYEAEIADIEAQNYEFEEENAALRQALAQIADIAGNEGF